MTDLTPPPELVPDPAPTANDSGRLGGAIHAGVVTTRTVAKSPDPAPTADGGKPLPLLMCVAYDESDTMEGGYAAELRVVANRIQQQFQDREGILELGVRGVVAWLRAEAERAEAP